jgi:hypothetical protein
MSVTDQDVTSQTASSSGQTSVDTTAQGSQGTPPASPSAQSAAEPTGASGADTGEKKAYVYEEDRSNWVPPYRLREISQKYRQMEAQVHFLRQQLAALTGVQPPTAEEAANDPEARLIREQFHRLFPRLAKLEQLADKLERFAAVDPEQLTSSTEHYWTALGHETLNQVIEKMQDVIGGQLTPFAQKVLCQSFVAWVESDPDLQQRYTMRDPSLVADYIKEYQAGILDPFRRKSTSAVQQRVQATARLPRQGGSGPVAGAAKPGKPADENTLHEAAWSAFVANRS